MLPSQADIERLLKRDPQLDRIFQFLRSAFAADSQDAVYKVVERYKDLITRENLLLLSVLGSNVASIADKNRLSASVVQVHTNTLGAIHDLVLQVLWAAEVQRCETTQAMAALQQSSFSDNLRVQQVRFQEGAATLAGSVGTQKERDIIEKLILATLASWVSYGRPHFEAAKVDEYFAAVKGMADGGPTALFHSSALPASSILASLVRTFIRLVVPSPAIRSFVRVNLWLFVIFSAFLLLLGKRTEWFKYSKTILYVVAAFVVATTLFWLFRAMKRRAMLFGGAWDSASGTIVLNASAPRESFRRSVAHEMAHSVAASGLFKRDLATLWEAFATWQMWGLEGECNAAFRKGIEGSGTTDEKLGTLIAYVSQYDTCGTETVHDYSLGYFIFGIITALCEQNPARVESFTTLIMQGAEPTAAYEAVSKLAEVQRSGEVAFGRSATTPVEGLAMWVQGYLILKGQGRLEGRWSNLFDEGRKLEDEQSLKKGLGAIRSIYERGSTTWGDPLVDLGAVLAGFFFKTEGGNIEAAVHDAALLLGQASFEDFMAMTRRPRHA